MLNTLKNLSVATFLFVSILSITPSSCHKSKRQISTAPSAAPSASAEVPPDLAVRLKNIVYQRVPASRFTDEAKLGLTSLIEKGALRVKNDGMAENKVSEAEVNADKLGRFLNQQSNGLEGNPAEVTGEVLHKALGSICPLYPFC